MRITHAVNSLLRCLGRDQPSVVVFEAEKPLFHRSVVGSHNPVPQSLERPKQYIYRQDSVGRTKTDGAEDIDG